MQLNYKLREYISMLDNIERMSTCNRQAACIILKDYYVVGIGYNGSLKKDHHCKDVGCLLVDNNNEYGSNGHRSCVRTIHAEINAILNGLVLSSVCRENLVCLTTYLPCLNCLKALLQIGITSIYFKKFYKDNNRDLFINSLIDYISDSIKFFHVLSDGINDELYLFEYVEL